MSPLPAFLTLRNGELHFEGVPLSRLAHEHGTPLFVYSKAAMLAVSYTHLTLPTICSV